MSDESTANKSFEMRVQEQQDKIEAQFRKITRGSWARIIRMARKPSKQEFRQTAIICGIGSVSYTHLTLPTILRV